MAITPWNVGQLAPAWVISLVPDSGVLVTTGLVVGNFALTIRNIGTGTGAGTDATGAGTFSAITPAVTSGSGASLVIVSHATVTYQPAAADVATAGKYRVWVVVTLGNGPEPFDLGTWEVQAI